MTSSRPGTPVERIPGRLLGLDLGERRIGVALADVGSGTVRPLVTLGRRDDAGDADAVGRLVEEHGASELVVGLPLSLDGSEGPQAASTRAWAEAIGRDLAIPVTLRDERLSSVAAEARAPRARRGGSGGAPSPAARRAHRARIDREAAAGILQAELDARREVRA